MKMSISPESPMRNLVLDVNSYFDGQKVHFFGIDYSGQRGMKQFLETLDKYTSPTFEFTQGAVGMDDRMDEKFREFRPLRGLKDYSGSDNPDAFVAVENNALNTNGHTGRSAISGPINILYGMDKELIPGKGCTIVYLMTTEGDTIGLSNFSAVSQFNKYIGIKKHMKRITPATYSDLKKLGMLSQISEREPETSSENRLKVPDTDKTLYKIVRGSAAWLL